MMYTKCMQNLYKMYPTFRQTFVYILHTKLKELWQLYTKCIGYWDTFCIHVVCNNSDLQKVCIIKVMYTICIQKRIYIQIIVCKRDLIFQHILTRLFMHFLVNHCTQLRLEIC